MSLIAPVESSTTKPDRLEALAAIKQSWGQVPNLGAVLALSLPLTRAVLGFDAALSQGVLSGAVAEQLAIAVSQENRCAYCLAAHSAAARAYGPSGRRHRRSPHSAKHPIPRRPPRCALLSSSSGCEDR